MKNLIVLVLFSLYFVNAANTYQATWESVAKHNAAPEWFRDAKFGIYFHWGVFSVPAYGNEWYPRNMHDKTSSVYRHHNSSFGDPFGNWPYHNFIDGASDKSGNWTQFKPTLKSEGGKFDPEEWAQLIHDAGAKYAGPVMEHHDGFSMWDSDVNEWNSMDKGPKLNLAKLFVDAFRKKNMKIVSTMHHAPTSWYYQNVPAQSNASLKKLYGQLGGTTQDQLYFDKLKEVIDLFQPDMIWQDFGLNMVSEKKRLEFLSYYFNKAEDWGKEVVVSYKEDVGGGFEKSFAVNDYERGGPSDIVTPYWLTDDCVSKSSWAYRTGMVYYSLKSIQNSFIDRVSKNGNLLLNFSPHPDGSIPEKQKEILLGMGDWLKKFGEAVYSTRAWKVYGEGPTRMGGGSGFSAPKEGNGKDIRFTRSKDNNVLYAIFLDWPGDGQTVNVSSVTPERLTLKNNSKVYLLSEYGVNNIELNYKQTSSGLSVEFPSKKPHEALSYPIKIIVDSSIEIGISSSDLLSSSSAEPICNEAVRYYFQIGEGAWKQGVGISIEAENTLKIGPHPPTAAGEWLWSGPNAFSSNSREIEITKITSVQSGWYYTQLNRNGCIYMDSILVEVNATTKIENVQNQSNKWSLNVRRGMIELKGMKGEFELEVFDVFGKLQMKKAIQVDQGGVSLEHDLSIGQYYLRLSNQYFSIGDRILVGVKNEAL